MRGSRVAVAVVLLAAGCGGSSDGDGPKVLPSPSPTALMSATPSATSVATGKDAPTPEGAAEFAKFFYAEISRGFAERDPSIVSSLSLPTCKTCKLYVDSVAYVRDKGQRVEGGVFRIKFAVGSGEGKSEAVVDVGFDFMESKIFSRSGALADTTPAMAGVEEQMALKRVDGVWKVATLKRVVRK